MQHDGEAKHSIWIWLGYPVMILGAIAIFFFVRSYGETLAAPTLEPPIQPGTASAPASSHTLLHLLLALGAVVVLGRVLGRVFAYLRQPPVIGEVLAGICLGPSLLGYFAPSVGNAILPPSVAPALGFIAQLGVILYMFVVGLELNTGLLRRQGHVTVVISHASIVVPFSLGSILALWLYPTLASSKFPFTAFALFVSVSLSITAFPVLARILTDLRMQTTRLGTIALACAAADDVTAWCLLALVMGVAQSNLDGALLVAVLTAIYLGVMLGLARPVVAGLVRRRAADGLTMGSLAATLAALLVSALATEAIGIHAVFGAFLFGVMIPHDSALASDLARKLGGFVTVLLLPAFFALTGMRTQIALVVGWQEWLMTLCITLVATLGKFGGTSTAARLVGLSWRDSASLGVLMNTRGLMELIVLNIGLDLGVISPKLFAMLVLMALTTTLATSPLLYLLTKRTSPLDNAGWGAAGPE